MHANLAKHSVALGVKMGKKSGFSKHSQDKEPGDGTSINHIVSAHPDLITQMAGYPTRDRIWGFTTFYDHVSDYAYVHFMRHFTLCQNYFIKDGILKITRQIR